MSTENLHGDPELIIVDGRERRAIWTPTGWQLVDGLDDDDADGLLGALMHAVNSAVQAPAPAVPTFTALNDDAGIAASIAAIFGANTTREGKALDSTTTALGRIDI